MFLRENGGTDIPRQLEASILAKLTSDHRVVLLFGPRQAGKTTLAHKILANSSLRVLRTSGDDPQTANLLSSLDSNRLASGYDLLFIDEAQRVENIGLALKILHDGAFAGKVFVTGSSSLDLAGKTKEALTGRTWTFTLFPIAFAELAKLENPFELERRRAETLVLGSYPALYSIGNRGDKIKHLAELCGAFLYFYGGSWFWRTSTGAELDYVEEKDGLL